MKHFNLIDKNMKRNINEICRCANVMRKCVKGLIVLGIMLLAPASCNYLDIVPENVITIDDMFANRYAAAKSLSSCYWGLPRLWAGYSQNPAILGSMESIVNRENRTSFGGMRIALGEDNSTSPVMNYWNSTGDATRSVYAGIRDCNTFLDNIENVADLPRSEKDRMIAEAKLLKAYMHFQMIWLYGPICPLRTSPPVDESTVGVRVYREKIDDCFQYVLDLIDEVIESDALPPIITSSNETGRFTQSAAYFMKAQALVFWASRLFNGNTDYTDFLDHNGEHFFNQTYNPDRWTQAAEACKKAIAYCEGTGFHRLNDTADVIPVQPLSPEYLTIETLIAAVSEEDLFYNREMIWANVTQSASNSDMMATLQPYTASPPTGGRHSIPLQTVELFYSSNGVPIEEDSDWQNGADQKYANRFKPRRSDDASKKFIELGEESASMNFDRELRFYSTLGFDRGKWYGIAWNNSPANELDCLFPKARFGEYSNPAIAASTGTYNATGYWPKKLVAYAYFSDENSFFPGRGICWPDMRYANLLLYAAEAINETAAYESSPPPAEVYQYIDAVRARAGLKGVVESWEKYSENASKPSTKSGMRSIIQRERKIELALEGHYHWDCRRWKTALSELNRPIQGWTVSEAEAGAYYQVATVYMQKFSLRDYFMPIPESDMIKNPQLIQNPGY
jgi:hypothetical protein